MREQCPSTSEKLGPVFSVQIFSSSGWVRKDYDVWLKKQKQSKRITIVLILSKPYPGMWRSAFHGVRPLQFQLCGRPFHHYCS